MNLHTLKTILKLLFNIVFWEEDIKISCDIEYHTINIQ